MSWSFYAKGNRRHILNRIDQRLEALATRSDVSSTEEKDALPSIRGIVDLNTNVEANPANEVLVIEVDASGSGSYRGNELLSRNCRVNIKSETVTVLPPPDVAKVPTA